MPRVAVTREWLLTKISEMLRVGRKLMSSADLSTYWTRVTANVETETDGLRAQRDTLVKIQGYLEDLEERLDAKS